MKRKILSSALSISMAATVFTGFAAVPAQAADAKVPKYQTAVRQMEKLNRGLYVAYQTADSRSVMKTGVYLSWRLLGTESLENQAFDIYRSSSETGTYTKIHTTGAHDATNYTDTAGTATSWYKVVPAGSSSDVVAAEPGVKMIGTSQAAKGSAIRDNVSYPNSFSQIDIPIERPADVARMGDGKTSRYYSDGSSEAGANDASVGDLDGDGDYEIVLKWDPNDSKDSAGADYTGNVYIDAYEIDPNMTAESNANGHLYKWRIDLGQNVTAGAHYTQFMVYDFNGDGKAEVAMKTAPGSIDGTGHYVTEVGDTETIRNIDNTKSYIGTGRLKGKNPFTQFLTVFDGETGKALWTTDFIPYEMHKADDWGDGKDAQRYNRSERYLAAVAYLDGVRPSIIMCRGYYHDAVIRAYDWDGTELTMKWEYDAGTRADDSLFGQGNHNLSIGDIDNDGKDEIVYGSAALDHDGKTVLGNTKLGHGDAMHMSDFNNDGVQEVFSVKEDSEGFTKYAMDLRVAETGKHFWEEGKVVTSSDNGRGVMDNIDDAYAATHPNALAIGWDSGHSNAIDLYGNDVAAKPSKAGSGDFANFLVYWDGDLSRELLDANIIQKYDAATGTTKRFYGPNAKDASGSDISGYTFQGASTNNATKRNPSLVADIWGDWREEVIMSAGKGKDETPTLRIYTSTLPSDYRLTTLMHDSQYRMSVAWQNVAYNQPTHQSYYIGSAALATDESGKTMNYLAPTVPYTNVTYDSPENVAVTGISMPQSTFTVEKNKTVYINASVLPENATKNGINWTSSDTSIATVSNGIVKGIAPGKVTVTATTKDGGFSAACEVEVFSIPVTDIRISEAGAELGLNNTLQITSTVSPSNASDPTVIWSSENPAVATVDSKGLVTALSYGKTNIVAKTADGGYTAKCSVNVKPIAMTDMTGTDAFDFAVSNTDENTKLDASATTAALSQNKAPAGTIVQKSYETISSGKAVLSFRFTTGGVKPDGSNWNWTGHEYTTGLKFLDTEGNSILDISQAWAAKAQSTKSAVMGGTSNAISSDWTRTIAEGENPLNRSATRWFVNLEFDYDASTCTATIAGATNSWTPGEGIEYEKTFALDGKTFKTLQLYTVNDGTGTIIASPKIDDAKYNTATQISGNTTDIYNKGAANTAWTDAAIADWTQTGSAALSIKDGKLLYNPVKPGDSYEASKTFNITDGAYVTYDIDWHFGNANNRDGNIEYLQIGDNLRLGWTNGYKVILSTDGGNTWIGETDTDGNNVPTALFTGSNAAYTKNVKVVYDTTAGKATLSFDGKTIGEYTTADAANSVKFGFARAGATDNWEYLNGIERIRVSEFVEGIELPDPPVNNKLYKTDGIVITAEYDNGRLISVKSIQEVKAGDEVIEPTAENEKVFAWDSLTGMEPIEVTESTQTPSPVQPTNAPATEPPVHTSEPTNTPEPAATPTPTPIPTNTPEPTNTPKPTATPTPTPKPPATPEPTPEPTIRPAEYEEVFTSSENFLMTDNAENKWIISSDGTTAANGTATALENTDDIGGNTSAKLYLANKAVQYVLDEEITGSNVKLTYDMYIDKTTNSSGYGRYFRTYFDNAAHPFDTATGQASDYNANSAFFHLMDYSDTLYTTNSEAYIAATQNNTWPAADAVQLSQQTILGGAWYRVVIENDLAGDMVSVKYYLHGEDGTYDENLDISAATPVIDALGCNTAGRTLALKQIKFMRTAGGDLYYDNIKLEKEITENSVEPETPAE